jgi:hypothetical protein
VIAALSLLSVPIKPTCLAFFLILIEAKHLLAAVIAAAWADVMGDLRLTAIITGNKVRQSELIMVAARALARF